MAVAQVEMLFLLPGVASCSVYVVVWSLPKFPDKLAVSVYVLQVKKLL